MTTKRVNGIDQNVKNETEKYTAINYHTNPKHYYYVYGIVAGVVFFVFIDLFFIVKKDHDRFTPFYLQKNSHRQNIDAVI